MTRKTPRLPALGAALREAYGPPERPPVTGAFEYYLWDRVGYLRDDRARARAFDELRRRVGLRPADLLAADQTTLARIAAMGGIEPEKRARHMREAAKLVIADWDDD